jgi:pimeloyl-ACP methyl ester carboxylesterase
MTDRCHVNAEIQAKKTRYILFGEGPCVVFLHGYMEDHRIWNTIVKNIKGHTLLLPCLPGCSKELIPENVNAINFMADVVHVLVTGLGFERYSIVGNSMGGYVAFSLLKRYSNVIDKAVLISTNPFPDFPEDKKRRQREIGLLKAGKRDLIFNLFINNLNGESRELYKKMSKDINAENMISHQKGMMDRPDNRGLFRHPSVPLHYMIGDDDALIPVRRIKELLKECEEVCYENVKGATHFLVVEKPEPVTGFIENALNA